MDSSSSFPPFTVSRTTSAALSAFCSLVLPDAAFFSACLPSTLKLVEAYEEFDELSAQSQEILEAKAEIEKTSPSYPDVPGGNAPPTASCESPSG